MRRQHGDLAVLCRTESQVALVVGEQHKGPPEGPHNDVCLRGLNAFFLLVYWSDLTEFLHNTGEYLLEVFGIFLIPQA